jgi:hypothetical protein
MSGTQVTTYFTRNQPQTMKSLQELENVFLPFCDSRCLKTFKNYISTSPFHAAAILFIYGSLTSQSSGQKIKHQTFCEMSANPSSAFALLYSQVLKFVNNFYKDREYFKRRYEI